MENVCRRCQRLTLFSLRPPPVTAKRGKLHLWPVTQGKFETRAAQSYTSTRANTRTSGHPQRMVTVQPQDTPAPCSSQPPHVVSPSSPRIASSYLNPRPQCRRREPAGPRTCCKNQENHPQKQTDTDGTSCFPAANSAISFLAPQRERKGWGRKRNTYINVK